MRHYSAALVAIAILFLPWLAVQFPSETNGVLGALDSAAGQLASVIAARNPRTIAQIQEKYTAAATTATARKVRILLVAGHEPTFGGAEYGSLRERDMTVELADKLKRFLQADPHFDVVVTRTASGWSPEFSSYFASSWNDIISWQKSRKQEILTLSRLGKFTRVEPEVYHNDAPGPVATRLYGIDKWANEHGVDIAIHIHFNDYPGHGAKEGDYNGFAIYVPEKQYANSTTTRAVADAVFKRLETYSPVSNLRVESDGIIEEQDLIAVGAYNSVDAASMLVEYGYIYEPQFADKSVRSTALTDLAYQTYLGLQDFFDSNNIAAVTGAVGTAVLPHHWTTDMRKGSGPSDDAFALQTALMSLGYYPPAGSSMNDCPRTGSLGPCTMRSLRIFQDVHGISNEDGVGPKTRQKLNEQFSGR